MWLTSLFTFKKDKKSYYKYLVISWLYFFIWASLIVVIFFLLELKTVYIIILVIVLTILAPAITDLFIGYSKFEKSLDKLKGVDDNSSKE